MLDTNVTNINKSKNPWVSYSRLSNQVSHLVARSDCTKGGRGLGMGPGMGAGCTVHIAVGVGPGTGPENIMPSCLHVLESALFHPCARVLIILQ